MRNSSTSNLPLCSTTVSKICSIRCESIRWPSASTTSCCMGNIQDTVALRRGVNEASNECGLISCMRDLACIGIALVGACLCVQAQWLNQPTPGAPRTPDGKVNMTGAVPRVNGKPDLSGVWQVEAEPRGPGLFGLGESPN